MYKLELLVLQATSFCNINCKYCYLPDRRNKKSIQISTVIKSISNLLEEGLITDDFTILWHAGEPLTLPISFYKQAFDVIRELVPESIKIIHSFQTNGLLINDEWCQFIIENKLEIGISLDGFDLLHDEYRRTWNDKGTFHFVEKAVELLKKNKIKINIIAVVTTSTLRHPVEFYNFFLNLEINSLGLNIEEIEGANINSSFGHVGEIDNAKEQIRYFLKSLYKMHLENSSPFKIREFDWAENKIIQANLNPDEIVFTQLTGTYKTITIDCDGNFSTFSPELIFNRNSPYGDLILGNIWEMGFIEAIGSEKFIKIYNDLLMGINKCKLSCEYYGLCNGGTPSNKVSEYGTLNVAETQYCRLTFQAPIDVVLEYMLKEKV